MKCLYNCPNCNKIVSRNIDHTLIVLKCNDCDIQIYITINNKSIFDIAYKDYLLTTYSNCIIKNQKVRYNFDHKIKNYIEGFNFLTKYIDNLIFEI